MSARFLPLPFAADAIGPVTQDPVSGHPTKIVVSNGKVSTELDVATGAPTGVPGEHRRRRGEPSLALGDLRERLLETNDGPTTELFAPDSPDDVLVRASGELLDAARSGPLVLLSLGLPGQRWDVVASVLGAPEVRLPGAYSAALAVEGGYAVAVTSDLIHAFRTDGHTLAALTIGIPTAQRVDVRLVAGVAIVLADAMLMLVRLEAMPFRSGAHHAVAVSYAPIVGQARGLREPGVVVATVGQKILVDHPQVKRITIERTPSDALVRAGDKIQIDDVREPLPGILKVHAWSRVGGSASVRPPPPPIEMPAPAVTPLAPSVGGRTSAPRPNNAELMRTIASAWGFAIPPALEAFLVATDTDAVLCRWLSRLGIESVDVRPLAIDWDADPCLVSIGGRGNGDAVSLYLYPPALATAEPIVVEFWHESNECTFTTSTFADFLGALLDDCERTEPAIVGLVRGRLGVAKRKIVAGVAPEWLPKANEPATPIDEVFAHDARGDLLRAERGWVEHYIVQGPNDRRARDALVRIYGALGWRGALDALRHTL